MNWLNIIFRILGHAAKRIVLIEKNYRLTLSDGEGHRHQREVTASSMGKAVSETNDPFDLVKIERTDPETGVVLGGFHHE
jgi:hypothetical protein